MMRPHPDPPPEGEGGFSDLPREGERKKVLVEGPLFSVDLVRDLLAGTGVTVEEATRPWTGGDVVGLLVWQAVGEADFARLPTLHTVVTASVGVDHIDLEAAKRRQGWVCHVPDYCVDEMADTTIA